VALADEHTRVVDALREPALEHLRLEAALQEVLDLERENVVETHARLVEHADADEAADERVALEEPLRVLVVELEQLTRRTTDLGQDERDTPDLALVAQAVLARELAARREDGGARTRACGRTLSSASRRAEPNGRRGTL
jgi:hypothetical protein